MAKTTQTTPVQYRLHASKEETLKAKANVMRIMNRCHEAGLEEELAQEFDDILAFLLVAERKLPNESTYARYTTNKKPKPI